jgi:hypothetical protein
LRFSLTVVVEAYRLSKQQNGVLTQGDKSKEQSRNFQSSHILLLVEVEISDIAQIQDNNDVRFLEKQNCDENRCDEFLLNFKTTFEHFDDVVLLISVVETDDVVWTIVHIWESIILLFVFFVIT